MKIWEKGYALDALVEEFTVDNDHLLDRDLLPHDCRASAAHARMLGRAGILTPTEVDALVGELDRIRAEALDGRHEIPRRLEDSHSYLEHLLTERLGEPGRKIHTGRSRNDQVLTALRLLYRERLAGLDEALAAFETGLAEFRARHGQTALPGYTHMRKAMPSTLDMWAGAFADGVTDDRALLAAVRTLIDQCPAGTGAGFGIPLPLDRAGIARDLGFARVQENPVYAQLSRGKFESSLLHLVGQVMLGLNRLAADLLLFSMPEFGFFRLPERFCTGSSIMPQKRNPDVLELLRAKYHEAVSLEMRLRGTVASLPSGYNRDLQLTKEPVLRGFHLAVSSLAVMTHLLAGLEVDAGRCRQALTPDVFATHRVYELVEAGVPFREAYRRIAAELNAPPA